MGRGDDLYMYIRVQPDYQLISTEIRPAKHEYINIHPSRQLKSLFQPWLWMAKIHCYSRLLGWWKHDWTMLCYTVKSQYSISTVKIYSKISCKNTEIFNSVSTPVAQFAMIFGSALSYQAQQYCWILRKMWAAQHWSILFLSTLNTWQFFAVYITSICCH